MHHDPYFPIPRRLSATIPGALIAPRQLQSAKLTSTMRAYIAHPRALPSAGNSGGPLLDSKGRLLGINTAILDPTGVGISSGVGFAIPIDSAKGLVEQVLKYGRVMRPALGVVLAPPFVLQVEKRTPLVRFWAVGRGNERSYFHL